MRSKLTAKYALETEFNNSSIKYRLNKLMVRVNNLEKLNGRNEKELGFKLYINKSILETIKLSREIENIAYNQVNISYYNINVKNIRKLEQVKMELEEMLFAFDDCELTLLNIVRSFVKRVDKLLSDKNEEFENFRLSYNVY